MLHLIWNLENIGLLDELVKLFWNLELRNCSTHGLISKFIIIIPNWLENLDVTELFVIWNIENFILS